MSNLTNPVMDAATWWYGFSLVAIIAGLILMIWWLFYMKFKTSYVYKAMILLYIGAASGIGFAMYVRILRYINPEAASELIRSWMFGWHIFPVATGFGAMTIRLYYQWWTSWRKRIKSGHAPSRRDTD